MSLNADTLIDRSHLKGQIAKWRVVAIFAIALGVIILIQSLVGIAPMSSYIARVNVEGVIVDDVKRDELFEDLLEDDQVKAVIVRMDSPGGTIVGGEQLYLNIARLKEKKPVVVVMRSVAASAGYMATLGASRIFASPGTITGSIGVIMQAAEFTEMASKLGIEPIVIKSATHKATPNPLEKLTPEQREVLEETVESFFNVFVTMVAENRKLSREQVLALADGRVFTGGEAVENGLIDALGSEKEAKEWLIAEAKLSENIHIANREPKSDKPRTVLDMLGSWAGIDLFPQFRLDGLVGIWQAKPM